MVIKSNPSTGAEHSSGFFDTVRSEVRTGFVIAPVSYLRSRGGGDEGLFREANKSPLNP